MSPTTHAKHQTIHAIARRVSPCFEVRRHIFETDNERVEQRDFLVRRRERYDLASDSSRIDAFGKWGTIELRPSRSQL